MDFVKMHGLGNDFVFINLMDRVELPDFTDLAIKTCDRRFGVGADGLVAILPSDKADVKMRIFNPDGSEPEMCGNAIRCFAKYVYEENIIKKDTIKVETLAGIIVPQVLTENGKVLNIKVDMGKPRLNPQEVPVAVSGEQAIKHPIDVQHTNENLTFTAVSMGNPHCIIFVNDLEKVDFYNLGPELEKHPLFPRKTNVEFVQVISPDEVKVKVWERGAGETLACGTGACAVAVAGKLNNLTNSEVKVNLPGGQLIIQWAENGHVYMTGPATKVFTGTLSDEF